MANTACYVIQGGRIRLVTSDTVKETLEVYQKDAIYNGSIDVIAQEYGVTPFFLLCAPEHVYSVDKELVFGAEELDFNT